MEAYRCVGFECADPFYDVRQRKVEDRMKVCSDARRLPTGKGRGTTEDVEFGIGPTCLERLHSKKAERCILHVVWRREDDAIGMCHAYCDNLPFLSLIHI